MSLKLVVDNTARLDYLGDLLRAVYWNTAVGPLPDGLKQLILNIDINTLEDDLMLAVARMYVADAL